MKGASNLDATDNTVELSDAQTMLTLELEEIEHLVSMLRHVFETAANAQSADVNLSMEEIGDGLAVVMGCILDKQEIVKTTAEYLYKIASERSGGAR